MEEVVELRSGYFRDAGEFDQRHTAFAQKSADVRFYLLTDWLAHHVFAN